MNRPLSEDVLDASEVRRRVVATIESTRRLTAQRRSAVDRANQQWPDFLANVAAPVFRQIAQALRAEGYGYSVHTPAHLLRLVSDKSGDEFIELALDTSVDPIQVMGRAQHIRGRRTHVVERVVKAGAEPVHLTAQDVLDFAVEVLGPLVER